MNKEELIQFLKDNLEITLSAIEPTITHGYCDGVNIEIELKLDGEIISKTGDFIQF